MRCSALFLSALALTASAQKFEYWPGAQYDPAIPTVEKVLGYAAGERVAPPADIVKYFEALAAAAPNRIKLVEYARTWERRKLFYAIIASEANQKRIPEIKAAMQKLADPRKTPPAEAQKLQTGLPAVIGFSYGVHGNEISSPDAAMMTAYHLLASRNDKLVQDALANIVLLMDPLQNPDGRNRFVHNFETSEGIEPDPSPMSAERAEPWPGGRSNHYLFDMNRDWFAMTQPETRGRIQYLSEWLPLVHVDLHEMGTDNTYFFAPGAPPYNPNLTKDQKEQMSWFGQNNAKWFDQFGFAYFTREVYDEFYPGYGASWPWYYGGMGMTYENASVRGLIARRSDNTLYTFRESVKKHFVAGVATLETATRNREKLLQNFYKYQQTAIEEGQREPVKTYLFPYRGDTSAVDKLAHLLAAQGIEVKRASAAFKSGGSDFPAGSYLISLAQPRKRLIRALLDPDTPLDSEFAKEQERRRKRKLGDQIYDVTAWSLPLLYNVESVGSADAPSVAGDFLKSGSAPAPGKVSGKAEVAYLVPWGSQAAGRFLTAALRAGLTLLSVNKPFTQAGRKYPAGTLVAMVKSNSAEIHDKVARIAASSGAEVVATNTSWVDDGINFGSSNTLTLRKPEIAMLWDQAASSISAGQTRFVLERQYGYPVTAMRAQALIQGDLSRFHVLLLPDSGFGGGYSSVFAGPALDRLKSWVRSGGVVVGLGSGAVAFLASPSVALLAVQQENLARDGAAARPADSPKPSGPSGPAAAAASAPAGPPSNAVGKIFAKPEDLEKATAADQEMPDAVQGVLLRAKADPELWINAGLPETLHVLVSGRAIFSPIKQDRGVNAVVYEGPDKLLASGYIWEENRKQLAFKPVVVVQQEGRGIVTGFTADPNFRAYMDGLNVLFLNSIFRGAAMARPSGAAAELREEER